MMTQKTINKDVWEVEAVIETLMEQKISQATAIDPVYADLLVRIKALLRRGGKRGRPRLVLRAYEAYGGTNRQAIVRVAASQELFHTFILAHDDIIDRDLTRWGGANISGEYYALLANSMPTQDARHFADARALLAGDICHNLSIETLLNSGFEPINLLQASDLVQSTMFTLVGGELLDIAVSDQSVPSNDITLTRLLKICRTKTAAYSFSTPLQLGAMLAGAPKKDIRQLERFGRHAGIAFQLRDDILGMFGDEHRLGKSTLSDLREGKRTLLIQYGLQRTKAADHRKLTAILGNPAADHSDLAVAQGILRRCGALRETTSYIDKHNQRAARVLSRANFPLALEKYLHEILKLGSKRQK